MQNKPILSICIPTYKSADMIYNKVVDLLKSTNSEIQIVVSDNCSEDETKEKLLSINDSRLKFVSLPENRGSAYNICNALALSDGDYAVVLMDKDCLVTQNIDKIIQELQSNKINFGYFELNVADNTQKYSSKIDTNIQDCFMSFAYKGNHPSGSFFSKNIIKKIITDYHLTPVEKVGGFIVDFMLAESCLYNNGAIINIPFVNTVLPPFEGKKHSYTYSPAKKNVFFEPDIRFATMEKYIRHFNTLETTPSFRKIFLKNLIKTTYHNCTAGYAYILKQNNICEWYNVIPRVLDKQEMKKITIDFIEWLHKTDVFLSQKEKRYFVRKCIWQANLHIWDKFNIILKIICKGDRLCQS